MITNPAYKRRTVGCYDLSLHTTDQTKRDGIYEIRVTQSGGLWASGTTAAIQLSVDEIPPVGMHDTVRSFFDHLSSEDQVFQLLAEFGFDEGCEPTRPLPRRY